VCRAHEVLPSSLATESRSVSTSDVTGVDDVSVAGHLIPAGPSAGEVNAATAVAAAANASEAAVSVGAVVRENWGADRQRDVTGGDVRDAGGPTSDRRPG
jgi:hypothetical protein